MDTLADPFVAPAPPEIALPDAPLVRVLVQVRFPPVLSVNDPGFIAPFQEAIRARYQVLRREQLQTIAFNPTGPQVAAPQVLWRFHDVQDAWRVSLAPDFVALETTAYQSRADLLQRLEEVLHALARSVGPQMVDRIGVRYIDRISGNVLGELVELVNPHVRGVAGTPLARHAESSIAESAFSVEGSGFIARWGTLPANGTLDPNVLEAVPEPSWVLDLDMFTKASREFEVADTIRQTQQFAERIYTFFRWAVTDEFLRRFGGKP